MSKKVNIPNNINKSVQLKIKVSNNAIFKESFIATQSNIKMKTFFKIDYKSIFNEIEDGNYAIYFLINNEDNSIYIGKSKNFSFRLQNHYQNKNKQFNKIIQLSGDDWTPTIIDYLEYWFINFFFKNDTFIITNNKIETKPKYNFSDEEYIENSFDILKWLLLTEGININSINENNSSPSSIEQHQKNETNRMDEEINVYFQNINAKYIKRESRSKRLLLLKGTKVIWNKYSIDKFPKSENNIKRYNAWFLNNIKEKNIEQISSNSYILKKDIKLSPSLAASIVVGYFTRNGLTDWKTLNDKLLKEFEDE